MPTPTPYEMSAGETGAGKSETLPRLIEQARAAGVQVVEITTEEARAVFAGTAAQDGRVRAMLDEIMRARSDDRLLIIDDPKRLPPGWGRVFGEGNTGAEDQMYHVTQGGVAGAMADRSLPPALYGRLAPPVTGTAVNTLRPILEMVRDLVVAQLPDGIDRRAVAGDVREGCYRVALHLARRSAETEKARVGLMLLELALTQLADGRPAAASDMLSRALSKLKA